nr:immunoglobulin light chain junction region [Macaca mulatta]MOW59233.1 immunoglobulin light chain junction region [Macaca mulatta]
DYFCCSYGSVSSFLF